VGFGYDGSSRWPAACGCRAIGCLKVGMESSGVVNRLMGCWLSKRDEREVRRGAEVSGAGS